MSNLCNANDVVDVTFFLIQNIFNDVVLYDLCEAAAKGLCTHINFNVLHLLGPQS